LINSSIKIKELFEDTETSIADMIITKFELGQVSYDEARKELKEKGLDEWIQELNMADELQKDKKKMH